MSLLITDRPLGGMTLDVNYATQVVMSQTGHEERRSLNGNNPEINVEMNYFLNEKQTTLANQINDADTVDEIFVPYWPLEVVFTVDKGRSVILRNARITREVSNQLRLIAPVRSTLDMFVNDRIRRLRFTTSTITIGGIWPTDELVNLRVAPIARISRRRDEDIAYFARNAALRKIQGRLSGIDVTVRGTPMPVSDIYRIHTRKPLVRGTVSKRARQTQRLLQYGKGPFKLTTDFHRSRTMRPLIDRFQGLDTHRYWAGLMGYTLGRLNPFLMPSYVPDIIFRRIDTPTRLIIDYLVNQDAETEDRGFKDLVQNWEIGRFVRLQFKSGNDQVVQTRVVESGPGLGEATLDLVDPVTPGEEIDFISICDLSRMASDTFRFIFHGASTEVRYGVISLIEQRLAVPGIGGDFNDDYNQDHLI